MCARYECGIAIFCLLCMADVQWAAEIHTEKMRKNKGENSVLIVVDVVKLRPIAFLLKGKCILMDRETI